MLRTIETTCILMLSLKGFIEVGASLQQPASAFPIRPVPPTYGRSGVSLRELDLVDKQNRDAVSAYLSRPTLPERTPPPTTVV